MMNKELGLAVTIDVSRCQSEHIHNISYLQSLMYEIANFMKTTIVGEIYHTFTPYGITIIAIVADSHIAIHTWPEYHHVAIDIFSCKQYIPDKVLNHIKEKLKSNEINTHKIKRISKI